jgi:hypothetical protein
MHVEVIDFVVNRDCESQQTEQAGSSAQLAEGAFDVRSSSRVVRLGEDGFGWAVSDQLTQTQKHHAGRIVHLTCLEHITPVHRSEDVFAKHRPANSNNAARSKVGV